MQEVPVSLRAGKGGFSAGASFSVATEEALHVSGPVHAAGQATTYRSFRAVPYPPAARLASL